MTGRPHEMIAAYFEGRLNAEEVAELEAWLCEDPARVRDYVRQAMLDGHLGELLLEENLEHVSSEPFVREEELPPIHIDPHALTRQKYASALSYVLRHTFTPKRIAMLATAAALLLGVVISIVMLIGPEASEPIVDDIAPSPAPVVLERPNETPRVVATLTAEHNAVWERQPEQDLYAGKRFTLTQGFAEITTARGAVAILQAPATIELLDNNNALQLHSGKLVGICETEFSKGFTVYTPHMTIIDLGTRFGVDASSGKTTRVTVFRGSVSVSPSTTESPIDATPVAAPMFVGSGQSVESGVDESKLRRADYNASHFDAFGRRSISLTGTGSGQSAGEIDPRWQIVSVNDQRLDPPQALRVFSQPKQFAREHPNDPNTSQWLAWLPPRDQQRIGPTYRFQSTLALPESAAAKDRQLVGRFMVDHRVVAIRVNGRPIPVPPQSPEGDGWHTNVYEVVIEADILQDNNTIEFEVQNDIEGLKNYTGFRVAWELQTPSTIRSRTTNP